MQPRFSIQIVTVISLYLTVMAAPMAAADCTDWDSRGYFLVVTIEDVAACLQSGANPEARDENGWTPLQKAVILNQNPAVIEALLDAGADLKARDKAGRTVLHFAAASNENPAVIAALLDAGANLEARDEDRRTPLHFAANSNENPAVIAALLDAGADPKALDKSGRTPWDRAKDREPLKDSDAYWRLNDARF